MLGLKQAIDTLFVYNWTDTKVQYDGTNIVNDSDRFIRLRLTPLANDIISIDDTCTREEMRVEVMCYSTTINDAMFLGDEATKLLRSSIAFTTRTNINSGTIQLDDNLFEHTINAIVYNNKFTSPYLPLTDALGNYLVDGNGNQLVG